MIKLVFDAIPVPEEKDNFSFAPQKLVDALEAALAKIVERVS
jgi:hypothetical protein